MADKKCRFRLNLFDGIIILLALAVGGVMLWMQMKPAASADSGEPAAASMHYTIRLQKTVPGTGELVETGDALVDVVKNMALGSVVSATVMPATDSIIDEDAEAYVTAEIPGYEDVVRSASSLVPAMKSGWVRRSMSAAPVIWAPARSMPSKGGTDHEDHG